MPPHDRSKADIRRAIVDEPEEVQPDVEDPEEATCPGNGLDPDPLAELDKRSPPAETSSSIGPKRRFTLVRFRDLKLATSALYLVDDLIPREGLIVVWGPPKCGKSFWVFDLTMHIALDWKYRGRRVEQGTVVYVAAEGERGIHNRVEAFRQKKLAEDGADPPFYLLTTRLDLVTEIELLVADIKAQLPKRDNGRCAVIVLDTLNRTIHGSESRDDDMGAYRDAADRLREEFHCAVIIIHHCGIDGTRPRGHTSLTGATDAQLAVKRDAEKRVVVILELMKDGPEGDVIASWLEVIEIGFDDNGKTITSCVIVPDETVITIAEHHKTEQKKLSAAQKRALQLLNDALNTAGEIPSANNHIPPHTRCVTEDLWREYCYKGAISEASQNAKRMAFHRAAEALIAAGLVGKWEPWVWPTR